MTGSMPCGFGSETDKPKVIRMSPRKQMSLSDSPTSVMGPQSDSRRSLIKCQTKHSNIRGGIDASWQPAYSPA
jgi:hypothetical protein